MLVMTAAVRMRELHRRFAPLVVLPLLVTVLSGVTYRLARDWLGASRDQVHWLMVVHEGGWLGLASNLWWFCSMPSVVVDARQRHSVLLERWRQRY